MTAIPYGGSHPARRARRRLSPGEWIALATFLFTLVCGLGGGIWWLSAVHTTLINGFEKLDAGVLKIQKSVEVNDSRIDDHEIRLIKGGL